MYIPEFKLFKKNSDPRIEFLLSFTSIITITLSILYNLLLLIGPKFDKSHEGLPPIYGLIISLFFITAFYLNRKHYSQLALFLIISTLVAVCMISGIEWGFDMPSVLLGYVMACVLVSTVTARISSITYILSFTISILLGHHIRSLQQITNTWHALPLKIDDIIEFTIILFYIMTLLFFSNREQYKLLNRSIRSESLLQKERDGLKSELERRTIDIKQLQMDQISHMYRFVEFGKMTSGLFHDLISPIQTLKLQIDSLDSPQPQLLQIKKTSLRLESMMDTIRKQIRFDQNKTNVDLLQEIRDIIYITRYLHIKNNVEVELVSDNKTHFINTNKAILNHVVHNLFSNACEACLLTAKEQKKVSVFVGYQNGLTYISVVDNGIGISDILKEKIFEPFYSSKTNQNGNCGIGLSSAKYSVEKHLSGKIFCESQENIGTTMTIII